MAYKNRIEKAKKDIFGNDLKSESDITREKYIEPPFSVLDTKTENWKKRKRLWANVGIKSEIGRDTKMLAPLNSSFANEKYGRKDTDKMPVESIFDPALCEVMYNWYCPENGTILDPFAGGSVRGIVANKLGFNYTGIDIRIEQIESNEEQGRAILGDRMPNWICGDSNIELLKLTGKYDMVFSCPPYADLEVYSDLIGDISNKKYSEFIGLHNSIIQKSCRLLKKGGYAVWVIGDVRDKKTGELYGFLPDTINAFKASGMAYYNEIVLLNHIGTGMLRVGNTFDRGNGKVVKVHQNVLVFKKINDSQYDFYS